MMTRNKVVMVHLFGSGCVVKVFSSCKSFNLYVQITSQHVSLIMCS